MRLASERLMDALNADSICVIKGGRLYIDGVQVLDRNVEIRLGSLAKVLTKWAARTRYVCPFCGGEIVTDKEFGVVTCPDCERVVGLGDLKD